MQERLVAQPEPIDFLALARQLAAGLDLSIEESDWADVAMNLALAHRMASTFMAFPMPETLEPAPVFDPRPAPEASP
jgi:hypothetical protein